MTRELKALARYARAWGGKLLVVSEEKYKTYRALDDYSESPFSSHSLGVHWEQKLVVTVDAPWDEVIHEMGHVFACLKTPRKSDEYEFFGWEYALALAIKANAEIWCKGNRDYQLSGVSPEVGGQKHVCYEFGHLTPKQKEWVLTERLEHARKTGLVINNEPQAIR